jgi:hypothetical protein
MEVYCETGALAFLKQRLFKSRDFIGGRHLHKRNTIMVTSDNNMLPLSYKDDESKYDGNERRNGMSSRKLFLMILLPVAVGYLTTLLILFIQGTIVTPANPSPAFDPSQCIQPPFSCWDGYQKEHFGKCTTYKWPVRIRGKQFEAGQGSCYKSIYWNVDGTTFHILALFSLWIILVTKSMERLALALFSGQLNYLLAIGVLVDLHSVFYSVIVLIHYNNDHFYDMIWSQSYFSFSEIFTFTVASYLLDKRAVLPLALVRMTFGVAAYHAIQLILDEKLMFLWLHTPRTLIRNSALLTPDLFFGIVLYRKSAIENKRDFYFIVCAILANFVLFQFIFADGASFSLRSSGSYNE